MTKQTDAIAYLAKSHMDDSRARAVVEVLETLLTDNVGAKNDAHDELRVSHEQVQSEITTLRLEHETLKADVLIAIEKIRSELTKSNASLEVSASKLQTDLTVKMHEQIRYVISIVLGFIALACAASASITAFLAHH